MANYKNNISQTLYYEGGLSKDKNDPASKNPVPDGTGYHTNKGVTWATFTSMAAKLGYTATPKLFYEMPNDLWLKIFKIGYWDPIKGDLIKSQALADLIVQMAWGSGVAQGVKTAQQTLNQFGENLVVDGSFGPLTLTALNNQSKTKTQEEKLYKTMWNNRIQWLQSLSSWANFGRGWTNRMNALYKSGMELINNKGGFFLTGLIMMGLTVMIIRKKNKQLKSRI